MMRIPRSTCLLLLVLLAASTASATKYAQPTSHRVTSQNGAFFLDVNPEMGVHAVFAAGDPDRASWTFTRPASRQSFLVSNDGQVVAAVAWRFVDALELPSAIGVELRRSEGVVRTYTVAELCPEPPRPGGGGPVGDSWRAWYTSVEDHGTSFSLQSACGRVHDFSYDDGTVVTARSRRPHRLLGWLAGVLGCLLATLVIVRLRRAPA